MSRLLAIGRMEVEMSTHVTYHLYILKKQELSASTCYIGHIFKNQESDREIGENGRTNPITRPYTLRVNVHNL